MDTHRTFSNCPPYGGALVIEANFQQKSIGRSTECPYIEVSLQIVKENSEEHYIEQIRKLLSDLFI
jgi:hypothetical protein